MQSLTSLTHEEVYDQLIAPSNQQYVGNEFRIDHLTSERGRELNGKTCRVVGFTASYRSNPDARLQCVVQGDGGSFSSRPILIKGNNLVYLEANIMRGLMSDSQPLSDNEIMRGIRQGLANHDEARIDRNDLMHRIGLYKEVLRKLEASSESTESNDGNALEDDDYCFPCGALPNITADEESVTDLVMRIGFPACVGNNKVDLRLMDIGLKGDGATTCGICTSTFDMDPDERCLVTLPCVHMFHASCLEQWLSSDLGRRNWNCPTCHHTVPHDMSTYMIRYEAELRNRFQEFLLSGFCPKCILWMMERDRNQVSPVMLGSGEQLSMGENVGQTQDRVYVVPPGSI